MSVRRDRTSLPVGRYRRDETCPAGWFQGWDLVSPPQQRGSYSSRVSCASDAASFRHLLPAAGVSEREQGSGPGESLRQPQNAALRGYLSTAAEHGRGPSDVLTELTSGNAWIPATT
jgi:hypothetical protein